MGDLNHGVKIVREFKKVTDMHPFYFAFKFQFRDIPSFVHPDYKKRIDIKYVKRFSETKLSEDEFRKLKKEIEKNGYISMCTPFDENSVDLIEKLKFDILKIGSCSFTDWPLLERVAKTNLPIIASTAGVSLDDIDKVVSFFKHRKKEFAILHCVGEYPTPDKDLQLNQIDLLRIRYPDIAIGYSTHEEPVNYESIKIAIAKGAKIFEKHVAIPSEKYQINAYSATPEMVNNWLLSGAQAIRMTGISGVRHKISEKEHADLRQFRRGVFAKKDIKKGEKLTFENLFLAWPNIDGQVVANDLSKYRIYVAKKFITKNSPIMFKDFTIKDEREKVYKIVMAVQKMLKDANILFPSQLDVEISHHYGLDKFNKFGAVLINVINREYAKKIIVLLSKQRHPAHYHKQKEETFHILSGDLTVDLNGKKASYKAGDIVTVNRGVLHSFNSRNGGIFEEVSTTHYINDSFYKDRLISSNKDRKTYLTFWLD